MNETDPHFVMSKFMNETDLYKAKAEYYYKKSERLENVLEEIAGIISETPEINILNYNDEDVQWLNDCITAIHYKI